MASFNTHWGVAAGGRPIDPVQACEALEADVLVLQEAWRSDGGFDWAQEAASALGYSLHYLALARGHRGRRPRVVHDPGLATGTWGLALLSRAPLASVQEISLGHLAPDPSPRAVLVAQTLLTGSPVTVAGTHLSHMSHGSIVQLRRLARALPGEGARILAGDMNMWGPVVSALLPGWHRAVKARTWPARRPHSQIDHVLFAGDLRVVSAAAMPPLGSDHLAVRARFQLS